MEENPANVPALCLGSSGITLPILPLAASQVSWNGDRGAKGFTQKWTHGLYLFFLNEEKEVKSFA